jgi:hypothetical protein
MEGWVEWSVAVGDDHGPLQPGVQFSKSLRPFGDLSCLVDFHTAIPVPIVCENDLGFYLRKSIDDLIHTDLTRHRCPDRADGERGQTENDGVDRVGHDRTDDISQSDSRVEKRIAGFSGPLSKGPPRGATDAGEPFASKVDRDGVVTPVPQETLGDVEKVGREESGWREKREAVGDLDRVRGEEARWWRGSWTRRRSEDEVERREEGWHREGGRAGHLP